MRYVLIAVLLLGACNTPSPMFQGIPPERVEIDGSVFDVRINGFAAEAIRVNSEYAPRFGPIEQKAGRAMAQVSGCQVVAIGGDQALVRGVLDCSASGRAGP